MKSLLKVIVCTVFSVGTVTSSAQVVTNDIDYLIESSYKDGRDLLDIYMPEGADMVPVIVFFHGGNLLAGDKTSGRGIGSRVAESGIGLVSANYRLSPDYAHPSHVEDAAAATAWVIHNIESYGGDPKNVFIAGHSSGAYLAALLAVDSSLIGKHNLDSSVIKGAVLISPFLYVEETAPDRISQNPVYKTIWGEESEGWLNASVTPFIGPDRDNILVIYADGDDPWRKNQNERFVQALTAEGNSNVNAIEVYNRTHTTLMSAILEQDDQIGGLISDFIGAQ